MFSRSFVLSEVSDKRYVRVIEPASFYPKFFSRNSPFSIWQRQKGDTETLLKLVFIGLHISFELLVYMSSIPFTRKAVSVMISTTLYWFNMIRIESIPNTYRSIPTPVVLIVLSTLTSLLIKDLLHGKRALLKCRTQLIVSGQDGAHFLGSPS